jgi:hypothetical protein
MNHTVFRASVRAESRLSEQKQLENESTKIDCTVKNSGRSWPPRGDWPAALLRALNGGLHETSARVCCDTIGIGACGLLVG